jgi:NAD(P)-dependent dehydrogenase (short-subunit alcohol dehydrogenase family)
MFEIKGHAAVVTGSTSGIGLALARSLAEGGADVVLNGLGDAGEIERVRAELERSAGVRVRYHGADMTEPSEIEDLIAFVSASSAGSTSWSTTPVCSTSRRSTSSRWRSGTRSSPSTCPPCSTPSAPPCP